MLTQLRNRVKELEALADEVAVLAKRCSDGEDVQPEFAIRGQQWYRGARELLVQHKYSGLKDFENCYDGQSIQGFSIGIGRFLTLDFSGWSRESLIQRFTEFEGALLEARALLHALEWEILSRELPVKTELSFEVVSREMDAAEQLLSGAKGEEVFVRAAGVRQHVKQRLNR